jgi:hypothetical protein
MRTPSRLSVMFTLTRRSCVKLSMSHFHCQLFILFQSKAWMLPECIREEQLSSACCLALVDIQKIWIPFPPIYIAFEEVQFSWELFNIIKNDFLPNVLKSINWELLVQYNLLTYNEHVGGSMFCLVANKLNISYFCECEVHLGPDSSRTHLLLYHFTLLPFIKLYGLFSLTTSSWLCFWSRAVKLAKLISNPVFCSLHSS